MDARLVVPILNVSDVPASIWVDDVDAVHERCVAEGLDVVRPPADEVWNVREMQLRHPDGHIFRIGREIAEEP